MVPAACMPIAVVKARDGHSKYGPISLVFNKDTIDPQRSSANKVYGGDAWTPTAPRVDYPVNSKKASQVEHELHRLAGDVSVAGGIFGNSAALHSMGIDDTSTRNTAELAEKLASTDTVRAAMSYWSQTKAQAGTYEKLEGAGLRPETALALQQRLAALEPEAGKSSVSDSQRCMVIAESGLSQEEQLAALGTILSENSMAELRSCTAAGIGLRTALEARETIGGMKADVDANGKAVSGSKKKKVLAYINGLDLGKEQKDALYLAAGYAEKGLPETPWAKGERTVPLLPGLDGRSRERESSAPMALPLPGMAEKKAAALPLPGVG